MLTSDPPETSLGRDRPSGEPTRGYHDVPCLAARISHGPLLCLLFLHARLSVAPPRLLLWPGCYNGTVNHPLLVRIRGKVGTEKGCCGRLLFAILLAALTDLKRGATYKFCAYLDTFAWLEQQLSCFEA